MSIPQPGQQPSWAQQPQPGAPLPPQHGAPGQPQWGAPQPPQPPTKPGPKIEPKWVAIWVGGVAVLLAVYAAVTGGKMDTPEAPAAAASHQSAAAKAPAPMPTKPSP